ncbi:MAG: thioredoxin family protein [Armatimonadota bacterium]
MTSPYFDLEAEFFQRAFAQALPYDAYLATGEPPQVAQVENYASLLTLTPAQAALLQSYTRRMNVLVLSGLWCGDCTRQVPMLNAIARANPLIDMRYLDSRTHPDVHEKLRINGALKVPVVVVLSEDFFELARFGDRHLSVYRRKAATELGPACDTGLVPPPAEALATELGEWCDFFERLQLMLRLAPLLRKRYED